MSFHPAQCPTEIQSNAGQEKGKPFVSCMHLPPYLYMSPLERHRAWRCGVRQWCSFCSQNYFCYDLPNTLSQMAFLRQMWKRCCLWTETFLVRAKSCNLLEGFLLCFSETRQKLQLSFFMWFSYLIKAASFLPLLDLSIYLGALLV